MPPSQPSAGTTRSKNPYESRVIKTVLALSAEKLSYIRAKREWEYRGEVKDHGPLKDQIPPAECQFCGHPIRYGYLLHNMVNKKQVEIGSECIGNFLEITPVIANRIETDKREAKKQREIQIRKRRHDIWRGVVREMVRLDGAIGLVITKYQERFSRIPGSVLQDQRTVKSLTNNPAVFFRGITLPGGDLNPEVLPALTKRYRVQVNFEKILAFITEAQRVNRKKLITAF